MQNLRLVLIIIGILIVVSLLVHGFWLNRKERSSLFKNSLNEFKTEKTDELSPELPLDQLNEGVGKVRVIARQDTNELKQYSVKRNFSSSALYDKPKQGDLFKKDMTRLNKAGSGTDSRLFSNEYDKVSTENNKRNRLASNVTTSNVAPALFDSAARGAEDEIGVKNDTPELTVSESIPAKKTNTQIIALHVGALAGQYISGEKLLKSFEDAGLQFGARNIFHYYIAAANAIDNVERESIFSVANMVNPGEFQLERMLQFMTPGVTLFMLVPSIGDAQQSFKIMLQTAQRIADDVGGLVLDQERHILSPQKITEYRQLIKSVIEDTY